MALVEEEGVALAMRRLSILDIEGGRQPIWDEQRNHCVVYNGETYNAAALRKTLVGLGHRFTSDHSDTEVLVHGYEEWGCDLFSKVNGMFALAIWDRPNHRVVVARDRVGEKPLYVAKVPGGYAFASELKALLSHPDVSRSIDLAALDQYLSFDFVMGPRTILKDVWKLPGGHFAVLTPEEARVERYWTLEFDNASPSLSEAEHLLDSALDRSVSSMMVADVPIGLFLSGGLDSTTVGYYMTKHSSNVHSFSIGFEDPSHDESAYALAAARHLGTQHHVEVFSEAHLQQLVPRIAEILDEPMADQSIFPTYLLSSFSRRHVKVALGGDGGDELLMGYRTYPALRLAARADGLPKTVRKSAAALARKVPSNLGPIRLRGKRFIERLNSPPAHRLLAALGSYNGNARWILSADTLAELPNSVFESGVASLGQYIGPVDADTATIAGYIRGYLQEDILVKVDRASMAVSLEVRSPFLDPAVIALLGRFPADMKLRGMTGKYLLRRVMRGRIPDTIIDRRKHGFGLPLNAWLRTSLAPLLRDYLHPDRLRDAGLLNPVAVGALLDDHLSGRRDCGQQLWPLLLLEMWRERWLQKVPAFEAQPA
jgi:asparagine synthase (glutamine-hydrolysing)